MKKNTDALTDRELIFLAETLNALLTTGARIGKAHYSLTLTRLEVIHLEKRLLTCFGNFKEPTP